MAGVSGLVELLCKSHFDSDPADSPSIALTQLGTDSIEASPCGFRAPLTRRTILSQTTVEDALNRLRHFSNTLLGADSRLSARFFHLLCKLYYDSTVSRIPLLKLCCDKLSPVLQLLPPAGNSGRTQDIPLPQRIEEMCANGRLQQPFHHLVSTVTLILYPPAEVRSDGREEPRKSELSSLLNQLVELLISLEPEEFHLDKGAAFDASSEGKANALKRSLLLSLAGILVTKFINIVSLGWINGLLGLLFGIIKVAVILGLLIMAFEALNSSLGLVDAKELDGAVVYQKLKGIAEHVFPYLKTFITGIDG